jgi:hypothetical protein
MEIINDAIAMRAIALLQDKGYSAEQVSAAMLRASVGMQGSSPDFRSRFMTEPMCLKTTRELMIENLSPLPEARLFLLFLNKADENCLLPDEAEGRKAVQSLGLEQDRFYEFCRQKHRWPRKWWIRDVVRLHEFWLDTQ